MSSSTSPNQSPCIPWPHQALERTLLSKVVALGHAEIPGAAGMSSPVISHWPVKECGQEQDPSQQCPGRASQRRDNLVKV